MAAKNRTVVVEPTHAERVAAARPRLLRRIIRSYRSPVTRAYCIIRFRIIRGRFLEEISQFLPARGTALEIGCGFGLFGLYFAQVHPGLSIQAVDLDPARIREAEQARDHLGVSNIRFEVSDARSLMIPDGLDAIYMLDIVHHVPPAAAIELIRSCRTALGPGGVLIIKDVDTRPRYKMAFTWLLDVLMTGGERPDYWSRHQLVEVLEGLGFDVMHYAMVDLLPYPHQLYVCRVAEPTAPDVA